MRVDEIDYLLSIDASGLIIHSGSDILMNQLSEWIDTPVGSVWGNPGWGNTLTQYRHLPPSSATSASIESSIIIKLPRDLPRIAVNKVQVEVVGVDTYRINLFTPFNEEPLSKDMKL